MQHEDNGQDSAWLQTVFERYEGPLVRYAARLVGDIDRGRDIVQDAFLRLCREVPEQNRDYVAPWLYRVCRNRALDVRKKEQRISSLPPTAAKSARDGSPDPAVVAEQRESARQAHELLIGLPDNQQEVIRLKIEHGLSYREISDVTGLSVTNVGYLLHRALQTLRKRLTCQQVGGGNSRKQTC